MKMNNPFDTYSRGMTARERRIRSKWALMFVMSSLIAVWSIVKCYNESDDLEKERRINTVLQTQTVGMANTIDSLKSELFIQSTIIGRYDLSLDHLKEVHPKAAAEFEYFMNTQTE
jgi:hypothetical protein